MTGGEKDSGAADREVKDELRRVES